MNQDGSISNLIGSTITLDDYSGEKFIVNRQLQGGMGIVLQLVPIRPGLPIRALKIIQNDVDQRLFIQECEIWLTLSHHPGIARATWYGNWQSKPAITADWYEKSLADFDIFKWSSLRINEFFIQVIEALDFALNSYNVFHFDIKPSNILIDSAGHARLTDFGLAQLAPPVTDDGRNLILAVSDLHSVISSKRIAGTPFYMAPELLLGYNVNLAIV